MSVYQITDNEFRFFRQLIYDIAGIALTDAKRVLLTGRLAKRLKALGMQTYSQYYKHVTDASHKDELRLMVDLLTTNETYFFREPQHFDFLKQVVLPRVRPEQIFRVWSAAASTGAEAYTIAMVVADKLGETGDWEILGTDISHSVLERARSGHYRMEEAAKIPPGYLKRFCLKGRGDQEGTFLVSSNLRQHVRFEQLNLNVEKLRRAGEFDVIFLRNIMIYFDTPTKQRVINNLIPCLRPGGYLIVGLAESLNGVTNVLPQVKPTIYQKRI